MSGDNTSTGAAAPDLVYQEYLRLSERCVRYVDSSFGDVKLYAALSVVFAWEPISKSSIFEPTQRSLVLLIGFVAIMFIVTSLSIYTLIRQALVMYYLNELGPYEKLLRERAGPNIPILRWSETYSAWRRDRIAAVFKRLALLIAAVLVLFPMIVLLAEEDLYYAAVYFLAAFVFMGTHASAYKIAMAVAPMKSPASIAGQIPVASMKSPAAIGVDVPVAPIE